MRSKARLVSAARSSLVSVLHCERLARAMATPFVGAGGADDGALDFLAVLMVLRQGTFHPGHESQPEI